MKKSVCYFGSYDPLYARNAVIIKGLEYNAVKVYHCQSNGFIVTRYLHLIKTFLKLSPKFNTLIVGFPGWFDLLLAFGLGKIFHKKIVFDVFTPLYESYYLDRKQVRVPLFYLLIDKINMKLADIVLADTKTHLNLYQQKYGLNKKKGLVIYVGAEDDLFYPQKSKEEIDVLFYGSYQPLQGVLEIVKAIYKLPKVKFQLIGNGQTKPDVESFVKHNNIKNIQFINWMSLMDLANEIKRAKIILGIFGSSEKAISVIPNKVFQALACGKAIITKDTKAIRELLVDSNNVLLIKDNKQLVSAIKKLLQDRKLRHKIGQAGFVLFDKNLRPKEIVKPLLEIL